MYPLTSHIFLPMTGRGYFKFYWFRRNYTEQ